MDQLVSIIIPVYNSAAYLETCLHSVLNQTYKSFEVIVINDGSSDQSVDIINSFVSKDNRIKLFSQTNHGLGYTRNKGMHLSQGNFYFFLDSDDKIPKNAIKLLVDAINKNNSDFSVGKVVRFNNQRKYIPIRHLEYKLYRSNMLTNVLETPSLIQDSIACNKLWRREFLDKHNLFFKEGQLYEDLTLTLQATCLASKIEVINKPVYYWRVRENGSDVSITQQQMKLKNTADRIDALNHNREWLQEIGAPAKIIKENEMKGLLDVLRLHVSKFALINKNEIETWKSKVIGYLEHVPKQVIAELPELEGQLYNLIMNGKENDLSLISMLLNNLEKEPIVEQEKESFVVRGKEEVYDVSPYLKPIMSVQNIEISGKNWLVSGELTIPKASAHTNVEVFIKNRKSGHIVLQKEITTSENEDNNVYPFERQKFFAEINVNPVLQCKKAATFDLYCRLTEYKKYQVTRVRFKLDQKVEQKIGKLVMAFYKTEWGNCSIKIDQARGVKAIVKKLLKMILNRK